MTKGETMGNYVLRKKNDYESPTYSIGEIEPWEIIYMVLLEKEKICLNFRDKVIYEAIINEQYSKMSEIRKQRVNDLPNKMEEYHSDSDHEFKYVISPDGDFTHKEYKLKKELLILEEMLDKYNQGQADDKYNSYEVVPISTKDFPITALKDYFNE